MAGNAGRSIDRTGSSSSSPRTVNGNFVRLATDSAFAASSAGRSSRQYDLKSVCLAVATAFSAGLTPTLPDGGLGVTVGVDLAGRVSTIGGLPGSTVVVPEGSGEALSQLQTTVNATNPKPAQLVPPSRHRLPNPIMQAYFRNIG